MISTKHFKTFQVYETLISTSNLFPKCLTKFNPFNSLHSKTYSNYSQINPRDKPNPYEKTKIDRVLRNFKANQQHTIEKASLDSLKDMAKSIKKTWLDDNQIRSLFMSFHQKHFNHLFNKTSSIYELEKFVFLFYWGQIYIEFERKDKVWNRYTDLLLHYGNNMQDCDAPTVYTFCKSLNYIASISLLQPSELKPVFNVLYQVFKDKTTFDLYEMRSVILTLNSIMIQPNLTPFTVQLKDWLGIINKFDFSHQGAANMALYTLENFKVLLKDNPDLLSAVESCLDRIPVKQYNRAEIRDSNTQRKIASIMADLGFIFTQNELIGIYSVDFLVKPKLVIDYHGVSHYYLNKQEMMIHAHQIKIKVLEKLGYYVQIIPFEKWNLLESKQRQSVYINELVYEPFYKNQDRY